MSVVWIIEFAIASCGSSVAGESFGGIDRRLAS